MSGEFWTHFYERQEPRDLTDEQPKYPTVFDGPIGANVNMILNRLYIWHSYQRTKITGIRYLEPAAGLSDFKKDTLSFRDQFIPYVPITVALSDATYSTNSLMSVQQYLRMVNYAGMDETERNRLYSTVNYNDLREFHDSPDGLPFLVRRLAENGIDFQVNQLDLSTQSPTFPARQAETELGIAQIRCIANYISAERFTEMVRQLVSSDQASVLVFTNRLDVGSKFDSAISPDRMGGSEAIRYLMTETNLIPVWWHETELRVMEEPAQVGAVFVSPAIAKIDSRAYMKSWIGENRVTAPAILTKDYEFGL